MSKFGDDPSCDDHIVAGCRLAGGAAFFLLRLREEAPPSMQQHTANNRATTL